MPNRMISLERNTNETQIDLTLDLDGTGRYEVDTGCGFLNHMLELFARHGRFDLVLTCHGDVQVDYHHTTEDVGIALGQAFARALGDMRGIQRYGSFYLPMDEALILCAVDLSGRCTLNWDVHCNTEKVGDFDVECAKEFWLGFARSVPATIHFVQFAGENTHHILEACFKGAGHALGAAVKIDEATRTKFLPRKDCWYDRNYRLWRGQPVQPEVQPEAAGAGSGRHRRRGHHPQSRPADPAGRGRFCRCHGQAGGDGPCTGHERRSRKEAAAGHLLGMQLLFEKSYEYGEHEGLGFVKGEVCPLEPDLADKSLKVPQIGWNALHIVKDDPLFKYIREGEYVYYVHSYYGKNCTESTLAVSDYSIPVTGAVRAGRCMHPVPPGKERGYRTTNFEGVQRIVSGLALSGATRQLPQRGSPWQNRKLCRTAKALPLGEVDMSSASGRRGRGR